MNIAILGAQGRLGQELTYFFQEKHHIVPLSRFNVDITNFQELQAVLGSLDFDVLINCVGICDLPDGQNKLTEESVFQTNTVGAAQVAIFAKDNNIPLVHISCASVLGGSTNKTVKATPEALDIIGQSKLEAEEMIANVYKDESEKNYLIVRLGLLFGEYGHSLIKNIERLVVKKTQLEAVSDIRYSFTATKLVAEFLEKQLEEKFSGKIEHCCHTEKMTVDELVETIRDMKGETLKIKKVLAESVQEQAADYSLESTTGESQLGDYLQGVIKIK